MVDFMPIWEYNRSMARAATTSDVFNAVAETKRRDILDLLRHEERPVLEIARELDLAQPSVSKHIRVLREVGLVDSRRSGTQRIYRVRADGLEPVHAWVGGFEEFWNRSLQRLDAYLESLESDESRGGRS